MEPNLIADLAANPVRHGDRGTPSTRRATEKKKRFLEELQRAMEPIQMECEEECFKVRRRSVQKMNEAMAALLTKYRY